jgi:hypothetical protein
LIGARSELILSAAADTFKFNEPIQSRIEPDYRADRSGRAGGARSLAGLHGAAIGANSATATGKRQVIGDERW